MFIAMTFFFFWSIKDSLYLIKLKESSVLKSFFIMLVFFGSPPYIKVFITLSGEEVGDLIPK